MKILAKSNRTLVCAATVLAAAAGLACAARPAQAAFPSASSKLVFTAVPKVGPVYATEIYSMRPDGSKLKQLTHTPIDADVFNPSLSADGSKLTYVSTEKWGEPQVFVSNADGTNPKQVSHFESPPNDVLPVTHPVFNRDGTKIAVCLGKAGARDIWLVNADGSNAKPLVNAYHADEGDPEFSPDGKRVVYARGEEIHIVDADGSNDQAFTSGPLADDREPTWSPDGKRIAFVRDTATEELELARVVASAPAAGGQVKYLTAGPYDREPQYSPSGTRIAFHPYGGGSLATVSVAGGPATPLPVDPSMYVQRYWGGWGDWGPGGIIFG